jgi:hypothetical protein
MLKPVFTLSTAFLASAVSAKAPQVKHDRFNGTTTVSVQAGKLGGKMPAILLGAAVDKGTVPAITGVVAVNHSGNWLYLRCNSIAWLIDGKPYKMPPGVFDSEMLGDDQLSERWAIHFSAIDVLALASAKKIELQLCNDEFVLPPQVGKDIAAFRKTLAEEITASSGKGKTNKGK